MTEADARRYHAAARSIEADGTGAYHTVVAKHGENVAGAVLILYLRMTLGEGKWPPDPDLIERVNDLLHGEGILEIPT